MGKVWQLKISKNLCLHCGFGIHSDQCKLISSWFMPRGRTWERWSRRIEYRTSLAWNQSSQHSWQNSNFSGWFGIKSSSFDSFFFCLQVWWNWPCSHQLQQDQWSQLLSLRRVRAPCTGMHNWSYSLIIFLCRPSFFWLMVVLFFSESSSLAKGWQIEATPRPVSFTCRVKGGKGWKNQLSAFNYKNVYV